MITKSKHSWMLNWWDVYAAAMQCKTTPIEKWDIDRLDMHPSGAIEFCDLVTPEVLRELDAQVIKEMSEGYCSMC